MDKNRYILTGFRNTTERPTKNAQNDTNGTSIMEANQNSTNINEKRHIASRKLKFVKLCFVD
jgi:hypothetical protein